MPSFLAFHCESGGLQVETLQDLWRDRDRAAIIEQPSRLVERGPTKHFPVDLNVGFALPEVEAARQHG